MLPIVSFFGSLTRYQLSKYLTIIVQSPTDKSRPCANYNLRQILLTILRQYRNLAINYKLVYFDVNSLFTSIPLQLALHCSDTAIQQSTVKLPLPTEDIMDLLNLCLTSTYFQYNGKQYKQLHGRAMRSLFLLLSKKLRCKTWTSAPLQLADKRYRFGDATLATPSYYLLIIFR